MKIKFLILFQVIILCSCISTKSTKKQSIENYFKVEVVQNGKIIKEKNDIIELEKKPFKFKLTFINTNGVYVSKLWDKTYYDYPDNEDIFKCDDKASQEQINKCLFHSDNRAATEIFNKAKNLGIASGNSIYNDWFYNEKVAMHFMDKGVTVKNGITHAEYSVENIVDADKDTLNANESDYIYPIQKINNDIYVVFSTKKYIKETRTYTKELQREKFILKFK